MDTRGESAWRCVLSVLNPAGRRPVSASSPRLHVQPDYIPERVVRLQIFFAGVRTQFTNTDITSFVCGQTNRHECTGSLAWHPSCAKTVAFVGLRAGRGLITHSMQEFGACPPKHLGPNRQHPVLLLLQPRLVHAVQHRDPRFVGVIDAGAVK